jgi:bifunctional oligoribonuclease and PAP phosphatase NrnA
MTVSQTRTLSAPPMASREIARRGDPLRTHGDYYGAGRDHVLMAITQAERILVSSHARPDGDAIGSILACGMMLEQMGKQVTLVSSDRVPLLYRWLPSVEQIRRIERVEGDFDLVILLECDGLERSRLQGLEGRQIVNIDHHASGRPFAAVNWIEPAASAVAEMVFDLATSAGVHITAEMATCLYTALLTDTGSFCYEGTDAHTLRLAAELVRLGACPAPIAQQVYFANPLSKMRLLGAALSTLRRDDRIAWLWVTHEDMLRTSSAEEDCEGIVNYAIAISGVEVAVFLRELPDARVRLSLRSKGSVNVAHVAEGFGGGGHTNASGCTVPGPLRVALDDIVALLRDLR